MSTRQYAEGTGVPVAKSQEQIERLLAKYKCTDFAVAKREDSFAVMFVFPSQGEGTRPVRVRWTVYLPTFEELQKRPDKARIIGYRILTDTEVAAARERETMRLWRALELGLRGKFVTIDERPSRR